MKVLRSEDSDLADQRRTVWRARYLPIGGVAVVITVGLIKYIGGFPHFVADAGDDRVGRWLDERIDIARIYAEIWKDAAPARLADIAIFCDSDDTHTASIGYFAYLRLERR